MTAITLLTDFGTADGYVAAMKGVIRDTAPAVVIDDAAHDIPPGDVHAAAWALGAYWHRYPAGTVHVVVVDPGVGSDRRALAAEIRGRCFVCPDNGVLTHVLAECSGAEVRVVTIGADIVSADVSATFHGRDIFAPAAARLATGDRIEDLGPAISDPIRLELPQPTRAGADISGAVIHVDRYGTLITNIPAGWLVPTARIRIGGHDLALARTYSDVAPGAPVALIGSRDLLEVAVRDGRACELLDASRGSAVNVKAPPRP